MIIDCIADLHGHYPDLERGDLLIVAGDLTAKHSEEEFHEFAGWIRNQEYKEKIVIGGNHEIWLEEAKSWDLKNWCDCGEFEYLCDSGFEFEGLKIWGTPWTKWFAYVNPKCTAFMLPERILQEKWDLIPQDIDILVVHGPPHGILDGVSDIYGNVRHVGSVGLRNTILSDRFPNLKYVIFGHVHENGGKMFKTTLTTFINASYVDENYIPAYKPVRIELETMSKHLDNPKCGGYSE